MVIGMAIKHSVFVIEIINVMLYERAFLTALCFETEAPLAGNFL
jgi:hypothetical protein